jgi:hypothetical protein
MSTILLSHIDIPTRSPTHTSRSNLRLLAHTYYGSCMRFFPIYYPIMLATAGSSIGRDLNIHTSEGKKANDKERDAEGEGKKKG